MLELSIHGKGWELISGLQPWPVALESLHFSLHKGALHFLRKIIALKDELYTRYIIQGNLLAPLVQALLENGAMYNLLHWAVLELFEFLRLVSSAAASARTCLWPLSSTGPVQPPASVQVSQTASVTADSGVPWNGKMNHSFQISVLGFRINLNCFFAPDKSVLALAKFLCKGNSEAF